jgi:hypothetical protein
LDTRYDVALDDRAIRRDLGYSEIVSADEGYRRTLEWQRTICPYPIDVDAFDYAAEDAALKDLGLLVP